MKKILFLIPLAIVGCKKEPAVAEVKVGDSAITETVSHKPTAVADSAESLTKEKKDSIINNAPVTKEVLRTGVMRHVEENKISRTADAEQLPFSLGEEFTKDGQQFVLKIENVPAGELSATLRPQNSGQNIRINQIILPDGNSDGPFTRELKNYKIPKPGTVTLIIGRSNMASAESKGAFTLYVE